MIVDRFEPKDDAITALTEHMKTAKPRCEYEAVEKPSKAAYKVYVHDDARDFLLELKGRKADKSVCMGYKAGESVTTGNNNPSCGYEPTGEAATNALSEIGYINVAYHDAPIVINDGWIGLNTKTNEEPKITWNACDSKNSWKTAGGPLFDQPVGRELRKHADPITSTDEKRLAVSRFGKLRKRMVEAKAKFEQEEITADNYLASIQSQYEERPKTVTIKRPGYPTNDQIRSHMEMIGYYEGKRLLKVSPHAATSAVHIPKFESHEEMTKYYEMKRLEWLAKEGQNNG